MDSNNLLKKLLSCEIFRIGHFKLKSGSFSPIYVDLRQIISFPQVTKDLVKAIRTKEVQENIKTDVICGVPYTALPVASVFSVLYDIPMIMKRKEAKDHGTKKMVEGKINPGDSCLIIEDIVSSGTSVIETADILRKEGLEIKDCIVVIDRNQGGTKNLEKKGIILHSLFSINDVFEAYCCLNKVEDELALKVQSYLKDNSYLPVVESANPVISYKERCKLSTHIVAKKLFDIMELKKTNLCVAVDTHCSEELLKLTDVLGPHICLLKTHIDILNDFSSDLIEELLKLSRKHNFLIFEDRKLADIGNTVKHQFFGGVYKIQSWADMVSAHAVPGKGILEALKNEKCATILIAEMSSKGTLTTEEYKDDVLKMAKSSTDSVIGYVAQKSYHKGNLIHFCPGVNIASSADCLGQQYKSPEEAISNGADIIIVGRGICSAPDIEASAVEYKTRAYSAYLKCIS